MLRAEATLSDDTEEAGGNIILIAVVLNGLGSCSYQYRIGQGTSVKSRGIELLSHRLSAFDVDVTSDPAALLCSIVF